MNETTLANIIKELSEQLHEALAKLDQTEKALLRANNDATDWFVKYAEIKNQLDAVHNAAKAN